MQESINFISSLRKGMTMYNVCMIVANSHITSSLFSLEGIYSYEYPKACLLHNAYIYMHMSLASEQTNQYFNRLQLNI